jgi:hypothetical protein
VIESDSFRPPPEKWFLGIIPGYPLSGDEAAQDARPKGMPRIRYFFSIEPVSKRSIRSLRPYRPIPAVGEKSIFSIYQVFRRLKFPIRHELGRTESF